MSATPSTMLPLGTIAPDFNLLDVKTNELHSLDNIKGDKGTLIMFICNHCPYVKHVNEELVSMGIKYQQKGINFIAISSNDVDNYPQDGPHQMAILAKELSYPFPYLYDETQEVAKSYQAACTPDFFLFDKVLKCVYRGQLDDSRPGNGKPVNGHHLRTAMEELISGKDVTIEQKPSIGCNIKWKK